MAVCSTADIRQLDVKVHFRMKIITGIERSLFQQERGRVTAGMRFEKIRQAFWFIGRWI